MAGKLERYFSSKNTSPEIIVIINCVLNAPQIFITIVGNTLVLVAVSRTPSIGSQSTIMLCSLAIWPSCPLDGATGLLRFLPNKNVCCSRGNKSHWLFCKRCLTPHYDSCSRGSLSIITCDTRNWWPKGASFIYWQAFGLSPSRYLLQAFLIRMLMVHYFYFYSFFPFHLHHFLHKNWLRRSMASADPRSDC